jgi:hypothetical protein
MAPPTVSYMAPRSFLTLPGGPRTSGYHQPIQRHLFRNWVLWFYLVTIIQSIKHSKGRLMGVTRSGTNGPVQMVSIFYPLNKNHFTSSQVQGFKKCPLCGVQRRGRQLWRWAPLLPLRNKDRKVREACSPLTDRSDHRYLQETVSLSVWPSSS